MMKPCFNLEISQVFEILIKENIEKAISLDNIKTDVQEGILQRQE